MLPRLKSISQDTWALLPLLLPVQVWPQGKGSWNAGAACAGLPSRTEPARPMISAAAPVSSLSGRIWTIPFRGVVEQEAR